MNIIYASDKKEILLDIFRISEVEKITQYISFSFTSSFLPYSSILVDDEGIKMVNLNK
ncbi:hypothetical protein AW22_5692 (plasmid) [Bacillus cereus D17]|nr:hypothetical protein AW22_5692 [Bacillus cereus D17]